MIENINKIDIIDVLDDTNSRKRKFENRNWRWENYLCRDMLAISNAKNNY